ncbi:MAG: glucosaminidase domain-containing protein [Candidatus Azobacteroides sp.]|nr:glucosaminidase domain-containing protein [Candidatus Azobacteroides sp.]
MKSKENKILFLLIFILLSLSSGYAQNKSKNKNYLLYIERYHKLAIEHMNRYKIPASITLAQGLLESGAGTSDLAIEANNHFGIKCGDIWTGPSVYKDDDEKNECFRKYKNAKESYEDHSRFLTERNNYSKLFSLKANDYEGWAKGLLACGYATDKLYAKKLIDLIELYELHQFDGKYSDKNKKENKINRDIYISFGLVYTLAKENDSFSSIASDLDFKTKNILKYNDVSADHQLQTGDIVYLQKKKSKADKPYYDHAVQAGETMYYISQEYGIRLSNLYKMNKTHHPESTLTEGTILRLR